MESQGGEPGIGDANPTFICKYCDGKFPSEEEHMKHPCWQLRLVKIAGRIMEWREEHKK